MTDKADRADETLDLVKGQFEEWYETTKGSRAHAERCRDYRDGKQWTAAEKKKLDDRGQPALVDNKIADKCDTLLGIERQMRTDPKAFPRTPQHEQDSEAATDALRYVADDNQFQRSVRKPCADNLMVEGLAYVEIEIEKYKGSETPKICTRHVRWDRGFYDVHALRDDFEDKRYCGFFTWMDEEAARDQFSDAADVIKASCSDEASDANSTTQDKPAYVQSVRKRKRLRVVTHFLLLKGVWHKAVWCSGGWITPPAPSTYLNDRGEPECSLEIQSVYRDRDGHPYGPTSNWLDRQDSINKRESKLLHLLNTKQLYGPKGAFPDDPVTGESGLKRAREEMHKPDGVIEWADGYADKVQIRDNLELAEGQWKMLVHAIDSLSTTGPNAALQGQTGSISGLAKQVDQQAGTLSVAPLFEALSALQLRVYRQMWNRVKQFWRAPMWIRVTDDESGVRFVGLNQPITAGEFVAENLPEEMDDDEKGEILMRLAADPRAQEQARDQAGRPRVRHPVAEMDVDLILDESPDVVTVQQQEFANLVEVAKTRPEVPFEVLLELSQARSQTKKRIMDKLSGANDPGAAQRAQMAEMIEKLNAALMAANVRKTNAAAAKDEAAVVESEVDATAKTMNLIEPPQPATKTQVSVN